MAINDLHVVYPNRNSELRGVAKQFYEFGQTIAREPSAAHTNGLDEHAIVRQESYIEHALSMVQSLNDSPIPDLPATHPTQMPIDFSVPYIYFVEDLNGNEVPLNEATQLLAEKWFLTAVELAKCNSASMAGSLVEFDHARAQNNVQSIAKLLVEIKDRPFLDLPETAQPGSAHKARSGKKTGAR
jgi:hypothetical protein